MDVLTISTCPEAAMKQYKTLFLAAMWIASFNPLSAQRPDGAERSRPAIASVTGTVVDAESAKAVSFASISLMSLRDSSIVSGQLADETEHFHLLGFPSGNTR